MEKMRVSYQNKRGTLIEIVPPCPGGSSPVAIVVSDDGRFDCVSVGLLRKYPGERGGGTKGNPVERISR